VGLYAALEQLGMPFEFNNNAVAFDEKGVLGSTQSAEATNARFDKLSKYVSQVLALRDDGMSDQISVKKKISSEAYQFLTRLLGMAKMQMTVDERRYFVALVDTATLMCANMTSGLEPRDVRSQEAWQVALYDALRTLVTERKWGYDETLMGLPLLEELLTETLKDVSELLTGLANPKVPVTPERKKMMIVAISYVKFTHVLVGVYASIVPNMPATFEQLRLNTVEMAKAQMRFEADAFLRSAIMWEQYEKNFEANRPGAEEDLRNSGFGGGW
jgi:hypothetical protein